MIDDSNKPSTFGNEMRAEADRLRRRFLHATRPRGPMSLEEASNLCRRMAGEGEAERSAPKIRPQQPPKAKK
jgi:hypothetical protein